jgi:lactoylglutathione lyase
MANESNKPLVKFWSDILELGPSNSTIVFNPENVKAELFDLGKGSAATILSLIEPVDASVKPNIAKRALHHVGLWVDDLEKCVEYLTGNGVRIIPLENGKLIRRGAMGWNVAFIHPKSNEQFPVSGSGVLIQLVQAPNSILQKKKEA